MQPIDDSTPLSAEDISAMSNVSLGSDRPVQRPVAPVRRFTDVQSSSYARPAAPASVALAPDPAPAPLVQPIAPPAAPASAPLPEPEVVQAQPKSKPARRFSKVFAACVAATTAAVVLVTAVLGMGSYAQSMKAKNTELARQMAIVAVDPARTEERQTVTMIAKAGQLMPLPTDEKPVVTTIDDVAKARAQSIFFANAEKGDVVMMYAKNSQAVLYRPITNKIVTAAQLTFSPAAPAASAVSSATTTPR